MKPPSSQAQGALERDQNLLAEAEMDLKRYQDAWARNAIPRQTLDDQEKLVLQDQGTVKNDQGLVQYDQVQVDYCHITAPITGRVGLRLVDPGNVVQASGTTPLVVVTQIQPITVVFTIPEDNLPQIQARLHQGAKLPVDAYDRAGEQKIEEGSLITLDNQIDTTTGTVKGRASFANKDGRALPQSVRQYPPAGQHAPERDAGSRLDHPAQRHRSPSSMSFRMAPRTSARSRPASPMAASPRSKASTPAMSSPIAASTSCRTTPRSSCRTSQCPSAPAGAKLRESFPPFYPASCSNFPA